MNLLYFTKPFFLDCDLLLIKALRNEEIKISLIIDLSPCFMHSTILNINNQHSRPGIYKADTYDEFKQFKNYIDLEHSFIINRTSNKMFDRTNLKLNFQLAKFVKHLNPTIIHSTCFYDISELLLYRFKKKTVLTVHDPFPHTGENHFRKHLFRKIGFHLLFNFILLNSKQKQNFINTYKLEKKNIFQSQLGIYSILNSFTSPKNTSQQNTILFFGRISPYKGVEYLLEAMTIVHKKHPELKLVIAGKSNYSIDFSRYINLTYIDINDRFIPIDELANYITNSLFSVCPYTDATQSGVILSAYALCKPVIATDVGGLSETVENGKSGLLVKSKNSEALAHAIITLFENKELRKNMQQYIYDKWVVGYKSWEMIAAKMHNVYKTIAET